MRVTKLHADSHGQIVRVEAQTDTELTHAVAPGKLVYGVDGKAVGVVERVVVERVTAPRQDGCPKCGHGVEVSGTSISIYLYQSPLVEVSVQPDGVRVVFMEQLSCPEVG